VRPANEPTITVVALCQKKLDTHVVDYDTGPSIDALVVSSLQLLSKKNMLISRLWHASCFLPAYPIRLYAVCGEEV